MLICEIVIHFRTKHPGVQTGLRVLPVQSQSVIFGRGEGS